MSSTAICWLVDGRARGTPQGVGLSIHPISLVFAACDALGRAV